MSLLSNGPHNTFFVVVQNYIIINEYRMYIFDPHSEAAVCGQFSLNLKQENTKEIRPVSALYFVSSFWALEPIAQPFFSRTIFCLFLVFLY